MADQREHIGHVEGELPTEFGVMRYAVTDARHVFIGTKQGHETITLRGVEYHFNVHLFLGADGRWTTSQPGRNEYEARQNLRLTKKNAPYNKDQASDTARKTVLAEVAASWEQFYSKNRSVSRDAELAHVNDEIRTLDGEIEEKEKELAALREKKSALVARETAVREADSPDRIPPRHAVSKKQNFRPTLWCNCGATLERQDAQDDEAWTAAVEQFNNDHK